MKPPANIKLLSIGIIEWIKNQIPIGTKAKFWMVCPEHNYPPNGTVGTIIGFSGANVLIKWDDRNYAQLWSCLRFTELGYNGYDGFFSLEEKEPDEWADEFIVEKV